LILDKDKIAFEKVLVMPVILMCWNAFYLQEWPVIKDWSSRAGQKAV